MNKKEAIVVSSIEVIPTTGGTAVFLVTAHKTIVIQVDNLVGEHLQAALANKVAERPQTHDLMLHLLLGLEADLSHISIVEMKEGVFFARIIINQTGPVARKLVEVDARPSDALVLTVKAKRPVYIMPAVLDACEDMAETLSRLRK